MRENGEWARYLEKTGNLLVISRKSEGYLLSYEKDVYMRKRGKLTQEIAKLSYLKKTMGKKNMRKTENVLIVSRKQSRN